MNTVADVQSGSSVFIDANIFIYHFGGESTDCRILLERCARRELQGYSSTSVLAEVLHRLMVAEAIQKELVTAKTAVRRLKSKPEVVRQLTKYNEDVGKIRQMNLTILPLTLDVLTKSEAVRREEGLLTNDSLVVAFMRDSGLSKLATTDGDFGGIDGLDVYRPADV
ncbi:MAG: PIN domain-containing protein [Candidatus Binatia bacterium]|jgi:predicted nucleic acid-binding protein